MDQKDARRFPSRSAYSFADQNGLATEASAIRRMPVTWDETWDTSVRRGRLIELFQKRGLLTKFIDECWPVGATPDGQAELQRCLGISAKYDQYLEGGERSESTEPEA